MPHGTEGLVRPDECLCFVHDGSATLTACKPVVAAWVLGDGKGGRWQLEAIERDREGAGRSMTIGHATKCLRCGEEPVEPDHGGIRTYPHSHFQASDRPADRREQALMDEHRRCGVRLNELPRSAPDAERVDQLIGLCSRVDLERNGQIRKELRRDPRHLERRRFEGNVVDAE